MSGAIIQHWQVHLVFGVWVGYTMFPTNIVKYSHVGPMNLKVVERLRASSQAQFTCSKEKTVKLGNKLRWGREYCRGLTILTHKKISSPRNCHVACSHSLRPTCIPRGNYILAHVKKKKNSLSQDKERQSIQEYNNLGNAWFFLVIWHPLVDLVGVALTISFKSCLFFTNHRKINYQLTSTLLIQR